MRILKHVNQLHLAFFNIKKKNNKNHLAHLRRKFIKARHKELK